MRRVFLPNRETALSYVLVFLGLFFNFIYPFILQYFVTKEFQLSPTSQSFTHWRKTPIPIVLDFYLFNWTNPGSIIKNKPAFKELGPYRFYETREKVNVTWNKNGTVSYRQMRTWHFSPQESSGTMDDVVTTINGVSLTAAYMLRKSSYIHQKSVNMAFGFTKQRASVSHTVKDLLFDGYTDNLMSFAHKLPALTDMSSPYEKFAWFYLRNSSYMFDGWFNLDTGSLEMSRLGLVKRWNNREKTGYFSGNCGQVRGFSGDMFPPGMIRKDTKIDLFSADLCSTLPLYYMRDEEVHGLHGYRFVGGMDFDNRNPNKSCFCDEDCLPSGVLNMTACRFGAPVFVSAPHFLDANPMYLSSVEGLRPDPRKHQFYITIEPTFGIPIDVGARVQLNMLLQPLNHITMYKNVPKLMFPVLWVDQKVTINDHLARELRMALMLPTIGWVVGVVSLTAGCVLLVWTVLRARRRSSQEDIVQSLRQVNVEHSSSRESTLDLPKRDA